MKTLDDKLNQLPTDRREAIETLADQQQLAAVIAKGLASGSLSALEDIETIIASAEATIAVGES